MLEIMVLHLYVICARLLFQTPKTKSEEVEVVSILTNGAEISNCYLCKSPKKKKYFFQKMLKFSRARARRAFVKPAAARAVVFWGVSSKTPV